MVYVHDIIIKFSVIPLVVAKISGAGEFGIVPLTEDFIYSYGNAVGKIQASCITYHGNTHCGVRIIMEKLFRKTGCFLAEEQVTVVGIADVCVFLRSFRGKIVKVSLVFLKKFTETIIVSDVKKVPVIQSGAF